MRRKDRHYAKTTIKKHRIHPLSKFENRDIYIMPVFSSHLKPTAQKHLKNCFKNQKFDFGWTSIYLLPRVDTMNCRSGA